jgi:hypothetical protein
MLTLEVKMAPLHGLWLCRFSTQMVVWWLIWVCVALEGGVGRVWMFAGYAGDER